MARLIDQVAREELRDRLDANFCVEAGAGTGKTTVLVARIVELLRSGAAGIDQLVVITFTEKAATELISRVREGLEEAAERSSDPAERERLELAIGELSRARIETIHAFAATLLRERPVEAGLDPGFEILSGLTEELHFDEAFQAWRAEQFQRSPVELWQAINRGIEVKQLESLASTLHRHRGALPLAPAVSPPLEVDRFLQRLAADAAELERLLTECSDESDAGALRCRELIRFQQECACRLGDRDSLERFLLQSPLPKKQWGAKSRWRSAGTHQRVKDICQEQREALAGLQQALRSEALTALLPLIERFALDYAEARRAAGLANFDDLLIWARDLLRDNLEVRRYFQQRFRTLLVDEFQDTDPLQLEIVLYLAAEGQSETDWRTLRPTTGKLFVVGDPKQSIYRFRRADIAIYQWTRDRLFAGEQRAIQQNFRSTGRLLDWVNQSFAVLIQPEPGVQPDYLPLAPSRDASLSERAPVVLLYGDGQATSADDVRQQEAQLLATLIQRAVREERWPVLDAERKTMREARWGDIAILLPRRTGIDYYEDALAAAGIPYRHESGRAFFSRQEVRDLCACLRAIDDPTDGLALVAALRSPAFACSDRELARLVAAGGWLDYRQPAPEGFSGIAAALAMLSQLHERRRELPLPRLVREVLERTRLVEFALTLPQGEQRAANLLKVVDQAWAFAASQAGGLRAFSHWLVSSSQSAIEESDAPIAEPHDDVVRLLTIHAAKGLEFPIVALANLNNASKRPESEVIDYAGHRVHLRLGTKERPIATADFDEAIALESLHEEAEDLRLLYVAATRARDHLIIPVVPPPDKRQGLLRLLAPCLPDTAGGACPDVHIYHGADLSYRSTPSAATDAEPDERAVDEALDQRDRWLEARGDLLRSASRLAPIAASDRLSQDDRDRRETTGKPAAWRGRAEPAGVQTLVEQLFELGWDAEPEQIGAIAQARAVALGLPEHADRAAALVRGWLAGAAIARARASERCYRRVPLSCRLEGCRLAETLLPLAFVENDRLVLLDVDPLAESGAAGPDLLRERAAWQAALAQRATRLPVAEVIWLGDGEERRIPVDDALVALGDRLLCEAPGVGTLAGCGLMPSYNVRPEH